VGSTVGTVAARGRGSRPTLGVPEARRRQEATTDVDGFIAANRATWDRLDQLARTAARSPDRLTGADVHELVGLHLRVSSQLSQARTVYADPELVAHLSRLVARSSAVVHGIRRCSVAIISPEAFVEQGWAGDLNELLAEALRRYLESHSSRLAESFIRDHDGAIPAFKGLYGFPATLCTSVNHEVVHGIPAERRRLAAGDVISIDCGVKLDGFYADAAITVPVGEIPPDIERLLTVTRHALQLGIEQVRPGRRLGGLAQETRPVTRHRERRRARP
jgi:hypothetical protein